MIMRIMMTTIHISAGNFDQDNRDFKDHTDPEGHNDQVNNGGHLNS